MSNHTELANFCNEYSSGSQNLLTKSWKFSDEMVSSAFWLQLRCNLQAKGHCHQKTSETGCHCTFTTLSITDRHHFPGHLIAERSPLLLHWFDLTQFRTGSLQVPWQQQANSAGFVLLTLNGLILWQLGCRTRQPMETIALVLVVDVPPGTRQRSDTYEFIVLKRKTDHTVSDAQLADFDIQPLIRVPALAVCFYQSNGTPPSPKAQICVDFFGCFVWRVTYISWLSMEICHFVPLCRTYEALCRWRLLQNHPHRKLQPVVLGDKVVGEKASCPQFPCQAFLKFAQLISCSDTCCILTHTLLCLVYRVKVQKHLSCKKGWQLDCDWQTRPVMNYRFASSDLLRSWFCVTHCFIHMNVEIPGKRNAAWQKTCHVNQNTISLTPSSSMASGAGTNYFRPSVLFILSTYLLRFALKWHRNKVGTLAQSVHRLYIFLGSRLSMLIVIRCYPTFRRYREQTVRILDSFETVDWTLVERCKIDFKTTELGHSGSALHLHFHKDKARNHPQTWRFWCWQCEKALSNLSLWSRYTEKGTLFVKRKLQNWTVLNLELRASLQQSLCRTNTFCKNWSDCCVFPFGIRM